MPDVYDYFDYQKLLQALYLDRKKANPRFSYRYIGKRAGFKSPGFFTRVLKGQSKISLGLTLRLADVFKLKKHEADYLELLVHYSHAKTQMEKQHYFEKILSQKKSKLKTLPERQYQLFSHWYFLAIREVLNFFRFSDDYSGLAKMVVPAISPAEARKAVETLEALELIRKNPDGYYEQADAILTTGETWHSQAIANFQRATLELAGKSFDLHSGKHRDISTLTVSISREEYEWMLGKVKSLQAEFLEKAISAPRTDRVYQINFQIFPLSKIEDKDAI